VRLTPRELDRLTIFTAAELARRRRSRGLRLNEPEAVALICDAVLEAARDGRSLDEARAIGATLLRRADVLDGVPELVRAVQVEALFEDGTKLVEVVPQWEP
jgi:urease subunit gamma/beta